jgi:hypothetical protein
LNELNGESALAYTSSTNDYALVFGHVVSSLVVCFIWEKKKDSKMEPKSLNRFFCQVVRGLLRINLAPVPPLAREINFLFLLPPGLTTQSIFQCIFKQTTGNGKAEQHFCVLGLFWIPTEGNHKALPPLKC